MSLKFVNLYHNFLVLRDLSFYNLYICYFGYYKTFDKKSSSCVILALFLFWPESNADFAVALAFYILGYALRLFT